MKVEIKIIKGEEVFRLVEDQNFISEWQQLASENEKVTVIQEPPFVVTWYHQYIDKFQPVLVLGYDSSGRLNGLMPLAYSLNDSSLIHAGAHQAEYHGWICSTDASEIFPVQALIAIKKNFNIKKWEWRSIPPGSDVSWINSRLLKKKKIFVKYYSEDSPVLDLKDDNKLDRLKKFRSNQINRYKRRHDFHIERIKSKERAREIFDILAKQCDFRQMATHKSMPFINDSNKKEFFINRLDYPENNHFTILWSDDIPIAYHFGSCDSKTVYLGLTGYSPVEEKNSPGSVLIVKLAEFIKNEGYQFLDLTFGGGYKEKYCNMHQTLYIPTIYFCRKDKIMADCKSYIGEITKLIIKSVGGKPKEFSSFVSSFVSSMKMDPLGNFKKIFSLIYKKEAVVLYKMLLDDENPESLPCTDCIKINNYPDLLLYNDSTLAEDKKKLLSEALRHFCHEELLFTVVLDGALSHYGWMGRGDMCLKPEDNMMQFKTPSASFILHDFHTCKGFCEDQLFSETLERMLRECKIKGASDVYIPVDESNVNERRLIEKAGFKVDHRYKKVKTLWIEKEYSYN